MQRQSSLQSHMHKDCWSMVKLIARTHPSNTVQADELFKDWKRTQRGSLTTDNCLALATAYLWFIDWVYIGLPTASLPKHRKNKGREMCWILGSRWLEVSKRLRLYVEPVLRCGEPTSSRSNPAFRPDQKQAQCGNVWKIVERCRTNWAYSSQVFLAETWKNINQCLKKSCSEGL